MRYLDTHLLRHVVDAQPKVDEVTASNRSAPFEGHGWIVSPDGRVLATTSHTQPFVSQDVILPSERTAGDASRGQPAPDWIDPLDTGAPTYD